MLKKLGESSASPSNNTNLALGGSPGTAQAGGFSPSPGTFRRSLDTGKDEVNRNLKYELKNMPIWMEILADLREKFSEDSNHSRLNVSRHQLLTQFGATQNSAPKEDFPLGHPKLEKLRGIVIDHFKSNTHISTRVMIFSQFRDSVQEITGIFKLVIFKST